MSTKEEIITIGSIQVHVSRKDIKNMHLAVYPPNGKVRLSAPSQTDKEVVRLFAISKLSWLKKQIKSFQEQERESPRTYVNGESHYFQGKRYLLKLVEEDGPIKISIQGNKYLQLTAPPGASVEEKAIALREWYRKELKSLIPDLLKKWEKVVGKEANEWVVKRMRTKWGTCNPEDKRIWLNLELAKKPVICLEYIIVHELVHLHERNHSPRFIQLMDQFMPKWRLHRDELNRLPVRHEDWGY